MALAALRSSKKGDVHACHAASQCTRLYIVFSS
jgi:hypothetical protein